MNKDITFSEQCDNSSLALSLFGCLLASTDTVARDDVLEAGTITSRFSKNRHNWIFIFQESPTIWISPSNKSAESEIESPDSHQVCGQFLLFWTWWQEIPGIRHLVIACDLVFLR